MRASLFDWRMCSSEQKGETQKLFQNSVLRMRMYCRESIFLFECKTLTHRRCLGVGRRQVIGLAPFTSFRNIFEAMQLINFPNFSQLYFPTNIIWVSNIPKVPNISSNIPNKFPKKRKKDLPIGVSSFPVFLPKGNHELPASRRRVVPILISASMLRPRRLEMSKWQDQSVETRAISQK